MPDKPRVAFLGLGIMGSRMAARILGAGFPLTVFNRDRRRTTELATAGAAVAATPAAAAKQADVIISMVADDSAARAVWLGPDGALGAAAKGALCIESSTVSVGWVQELAEAASSRGCEFLDAPVTGSRLQAQAGELNFLVGGPPATLDLARPVLAAMGRNILPLGPVGSGAMTKLINNFVCGVQLVAIAEAITFMERAGLDRARALEVLLNGAPASPLVKTVSARMTAGDFTPNFLLRLMAKDVGYAVEEARKKSLELTTASAAHRTLSRAIGAGHGDQDMSAVIEAVRACSTAKPTT
jgi:3-hydroxyisobutyrate dehydrogenase